MRAACCRWKRSTSTSSSTLPLRTSCHLSRSIAGSRANARRGVPSSIAVTRVDEQRAVLLVGLVEQVEMQAQVVGDDARVVPAAELARRVLGQVRADRLDRGEPVAQHPQLEPPLRDRERTVLAQTPLIHGRRDHVDGGGQVVRRERDRDVLVDDALREAEAVRVPEGAPVELVPRGPVGEQRAAAAHVGLQARARERARQELRLRRALAREALHVAGGEVRAGRVERAEQPLVGVGRQHVIGVDERQELAGGRVQAGVAGASQAAVGLGEEPEPAVLERRSARPAPGCRRSSRRRP